MPTGLFVHHSFLMPHTPFFALFVFSNGIYNFLMLLLLLLLSITSILLLLYLLCLDLCSKYDGRDCSRLVADQGESQQYTLHQYDQYIFADTESKGSYYISTHSKVPPLLLQAVSQLVVFPTLLDGRRGEIDT